MSYTIVKTECANGAVRWSHEMDDDGKRHPVQDPMIDAMEEKFPGSKRRKVDGVFVYKNADGKVIKQKDLPKIKFKVGKPGYKAPTEKELARRKEAKGASRAKVELSANKKRRGVGKKGDGNKVRGRGKKSRDTSSGDESGGDDESDDGGPDGGGSDGGGSDGGGSDGDGSDGDGSDGDGSDGGGSEDLDESDGGDDETDGGDDESDGGDDDRDDRDESGDESDDDEDTGEEKHSRVDIGGEFGTLSREQLVEILTAVTRAKKNDGEYGDDDDASREKRTSHKPPLRNRRRGVRFIDESTGHRSSVGSESVSDVSNRRGIETVASSPSPRHRHRGREVTLQPSRNRRHIPDRKAHLQREKLTGVAFPLMVRINVDAAGLTMTDAYAEYVRASDESPGGQIVMQLELSQYADIVGIKHHSSGRVNDCVYAWIIYESKTSRLYIRTSKRPLQSAGRGDFLASVSRVKRRDGSDDTTNNDDDVVRRFNCMSRFQTGKPEPSYPSDERVCKMISESSLDPDVSAELHQSRIGSYSHIQVGGTLPSSATTTAAANTRRHSDTHTPPRTLVFHMALPREWKRRLEWLAPVHSISVYIPDKTSRNWERELELDVETTDEHRAARRMDKSSTSCGDYRGSERKYTRR